MRQIEVVKQKLQQESAGDRSESQTIAAREGRTWQRPLFCCSLISHGSALLSPSDESYDGCRISFYCSSVPIAAQRAVYNFRVARKIVHAVQAQRLDTLRIAKREMFRESPRGWRR